MPFWRVCPRCGPIEEHGVLEYREVLQILQKTAGVIKLGKAPYGLPKTRPSTIFSGSSAISRAMNAAIDSEAGIILSPRSF